LFKYEQSVINFNEKMKKWILWNEALDTLQPSEQLLTGNDFIEVQNLKNLIPAQANSIF